MENLIKALQIFLKYGNPEWPTACEHDVLYVQIEYSLVSEEDKEELDKLGFLNVKIQAVLCHISMGAVKMKKWNIKVVARFWLVIFFVMMFGWTSNFLQVMTKDHNGLNEVGIFVVPVGVYLGYVR